MKIAIASFAKTISLSPVKTRLAKSIGVESAEVFYLLSVACINAVLEETKRQDSDIFPHWALADEKAVGLDAWQSFPNLWTGEGGLGERLFNISDRLFQTHDAVILIGTDSPQLRVEQLLKFSNMLRTRSDFDHVVGSATDGGFWLWGSTKALPLSVWDNVTYSTDTTLEELMRATNNYGHSVFKSDEMQDVDVVEDIVRLQKTFEQESKTLLPAQKVLLKWLQEHNPTFRG